MLIMTACIGMHLANLELSLGAAKCFRECPSAVVTTKDVEMEFENYFLITPKGHRCEIVI
jgi:cytochrome P450